MAGKQNMQQATQADFVVDLDANWFANTKEQDGAPIALVPRGHHTFEIYECERQNKEGTKPHTMIRIKSKVVASSNAEGVGLTLDTLVAGSKQSPDFMQGRLKNVLLAIGYQPQNDGLKPKRDLVGKRYDATVIWELSDPQPTKDGGSRRYVNARAKYERKVGGPVPEKAANFELESKDAIAFKAGSGSGGSGDTTHFGSEESSSDQAPWMAGAGGDESDTDQAQMGAAGFKDDSEAGEQLAMVMEYRAHIYLGTEGLADECRAGLEQAGFDPEGNLDESMLDDELKAKVLHKRNPPQAQPAGGLKPLGGGLAGLNTKPKAGTTGTRAAGK